LSSVHIVIFPPVPSPSIVPLPPPPVPEILDYYNTTNFLVTISSTAILAVDCVPLPVVSAVNFKYEAGD